MCSITGLPATEFVLNKDGQRRMPHQYISDVEISVDESPELISLYFPMENVCGSTAVLRKLWVVSYYYMYYSDRLGGLCQKRVKVNKNFGSVMLD